MSRAKLSVAASLAICAAIAAGCGKGGYGIKVPRSAGAIYHGAVLFNARCSGCHTLSAANTQGSKPPGRIAGGERTNGPNLDQRHENVADVLFAIRNGGFSGAIMPANIVMGNDAQEVAMFVARYAGSKSKSAQK